MAIDVFFYSENSIEATKKIVERLIADDTYYSTDFILSDVFAPGEAFVILEESLFNIKPQSMFLGSLETSDAIVRRVEIVNKIRANFTNITALWENEKVI